MPIAAPYPAPKKRRSLLPLLTVVFIVSYALMTMLIVEQGGVIQQQHGLIQILQSDSMELWAMKAKAGVDKANRERAKAAAAAGTKNPDAPTKAPATQAPTAQQPAAQIHQQRSQSNSGKGAKQHIQLPPVPATDLGDQRRVLITL
jgi:hypothetical protein